MAINLVIFCEIYFCELPQATTFCGNYFYEFIANSLKKMSSFVLGWTKEKKLCLTQHFILKSNTFSSTVELSATNLEGYVFMYYKSL